MAMALVESMRAEANQGKVVKLFFFQILTFKLTNKQINKAMHK